MSRLNITALIESHTYFPVAPGCSFDSLARSGHPSVMIPEMLAITALVLARRPFAGRVPQGGVGTVDPRQDRVQVRLPMLAS
ncbi:hypothetical protein V2S85_26260 [Novosphingobium resinovorum]|nr:hypothetical protein [Novosphingobium resinovorum]